jgi:hypothetical protein
MDFLESHFAIEKLMKKKHFSGFDEIVSFYTKDQRKSSDPFYKRDLKISI